MARPRLLDWDELREAIPPTYCEWIGMQLLEAIGVPH